MNQYWKWEKCKNYVLCTLPSNQDDIETNLVEHRNALRLIQLFEPVFGIIYNTVCTFSLYGFDTEEVPMFNYGIKCILPTDNEELKECIIHLFDHSLQYNYIDIIIRKKQYSELVDNCEQNGLRTFIPPSQMYLFNEVLITLSIQFKPMKLVSFYGYLRQYTSERYKNKGICSKLLYTTCNIVQNVLYKKVITKVVVPGIYIDIAEVVPVITNIVPVIAVVPEVVKVIPEVVLVVAEVVPVITVIPVILEVVPVVAEVVPS